MAFQCDLCGKTFVGKPEITINKRPGAPFWQGNIYLDVCELCAPRLVSAMEKIKQDGEV